MGAEDQYQDQEGEELEVVNLADVNVDDLLVTDAKRHSDEVGERAIKTIEEKGQGHGSFDYSIGQVKKAEDLLETMGALAKDIERIEAHMLAREGQVTKNLPKVLAAKKEALAAKEKELEGMDQTSTFRTLQEEEKRSNEEYAVALDYVETAESNAHKELILDGEYELAFSLITRPRVDKGHAEFNRAKRTVNDKKAAWIKSSYSSYPDKKAYIESVNVALLERQQDSISKETLQYGFSKTDDIVGDEETGVTADEVRREMGKVVREQTDKAAKEESEAQAAKDEEGQRERVSQREASRKDRIISDLLKGDTYLSPTFEELGPEMVQRVKEAFEKELDDNDVIEAYRLAKPGLKALATLLNPESKLRLGGSEKKNFYAAISEAGLDTGQAYAIIGNAPIKSAIEALKQGKKRYNEEAKKIDAQIKILKKPGGFLSTNNKKASAVNWAVGAIEELLPVTTTGKYGSVLDRSLGVRSARDNIINACLKDVEAYRKDEVVPNIAAIDVVLSEEDSLLALQELSKGDEGPHGDLHYVESRTGKAVRYLGIIERGGSK